MALNVGRWFKYAQAKLDAAARSGNEELDQLEAERAAEIAERPWLASDGTAPSFDEARARIEWEAEQAKRQAEIAEAASTDQVPPSAPASEVGADDPSGAGAPSPDADRAPAAPKPPVRSSGTEAEVAAAKLELEQRERDARTRLDAIRDELGIDPPAPGSP